MTNDLIKQMTERFLSWKLPADFNPDNGISAERPNHAPGVAWEPTGTNLFTFTQAESMVRHMLGGADEIARKDGSPFSQAEHERYVIRDDVPPTVHARMNETTGRWESPIDVRAPEPPLDTIQRLGQEMQHADQADVLRERIARESADNAVEMHGAARGTHTWEIAKDAALSALKAQEG